MKILTISNCPLIESQGSGYVIVNFARGLQQRGHQVDLFGPDDYEPLKFLRGRGNQYRQALGMLVFTLSQLVKKRYDIIEYYGAEAWLIVELLSKIKHRPLLISHSNGLETRSYEVTKNSVKFSNDAPARKWYHLNQTGFFNRFFNSVDALVTVSEVETQFALRSNYQKESKILTIENSLPNDYLGNHVNLEKEPVIGYCGSWLFRKGIHLIKNDMPHILKEFPHAKFKLIGVGHSFKKAEHFPPNVWDQIEVIPFIDSKKLLKQIYQTISIFIVPSICESFGLVSAEAMSCGCALVANKTGFAASLNHESEAMLMNEPISPYLYECIKKLLTNETLRTNIAKGGYQRVQQLRWDLAIDKLETTYLKWLDEYRTRT